MFKASSMGGVIFIQKELSSKFYPEISHAKECLGMQNATFYETNDSTPVDIINKLVFQSIFFIAPIIQRHCKICTSGSGLVEG